MKKQVVCILTSMALTLGMVPVAPYAATMGDAAVVQSVQQADGGTSYLDGQGISQIVAATPVSATTTVLDGNAASWYVVDKDISVNERVKVKGNVNLIIADSVVYTAKQGIEVTKGNTLNIYGQGKCDGRIYAQGKEKFAGIGGDASNNAGTITINGGIVEAAGGISCAGIGGGDSKYGGNLTVNGGFAIVTAGNNSSALGGGQSSTGGSITVNGGNILAKGGIYGAGIGAGYAGIIDTIDINAGNVESFGGLYGASIGSGFNGKGGAIEISGGQVYAKGGESGTGIGDTLAGSGDTFTTGPNGNAVIYTTAIDNKEAQDSWSGVIIEGQTGKVYGTNVDLMQDIFIPKGTTVEIPKDKTLTIPKDITLTNEGVIDASAGGVLKKTGTFVNNGTFLGKQVDDGDNKEDVQTDACSFVGNSVSMKDSITMNYYVTLSDAALKNPKAFMQFKVNGNMAEKVYVQDVLNDTLKVNEKICYKFSCPVSARQMTDSIEAYFCVPDADGQYVPAHVRTFSIEGYGDNLLHNKAVDASFETLEVVKAMLNYGAAAQLQFNYHTDSLANKSMTQEEKAVIQQVQKSDFDKYDLIKTGNVDGITYKGAALGLKSETILKHYLELGKNKNIKNYKVELIDQTDGSTTNLTPVYNSKLGLYCVDIAGIVTRNLDDEYTIRITSVKGNKQNMTISCSPLYYGRKTFNNSGSTQELKNVMKALYQYNEAADLFAQSLYK